MILHCLHKAPKTLPVLSEIAFFTNDCNLFMACIHKGLSAFISPPPVISKHTVKRCSFYIPFCQDHWHSLLFQMEKFISRPPVIRSCGSNDKPFHSLVFSSLQKLMLLLYIPSCVHKNNIVAERLSQTADPFQNPTVNSLTCGRENHSNTEAVSSAQTPCNQTGRIVIFLNCRHYLFLCLFFHISRTI